MSESADQRLLELLRTDPRRAWAALIETHYERVYRFLLHLTRDVAQAEDLTQDTFVTAWEKIAGFREQSALTTWLHRVAYRKFIDGRRAHLRGVALAGRLAERRESVTPPDPLDVATAADEAHHLAAAVEQLDEADRVVVVLHYFQDLSYRDMAEVLGQPAGTVKWRTSEALRKLRGLLTAEENSHDAPAALP